MRFQGFLSHLDAWIIFVQSFDWCESFLSRPTPIWGVSEGAQRADAGPRLVSLSQHKEPHPRYLFDRTAYMTVGGIHVDSILLTSQWKISLFFFLKFTTAWIFFLCMFMNDFHYYHHTSCHLSTICSVISFSIWWHIVNKMF